MLLIAQRGRQCRLKPFHSARIAEPAKASLFAMESAPPSVESTPPTWLELLPYEAFHQVLGALCGWHFSSSPVNEAYDLASVSDKLLEAVQESLDETAVFSNEQDFDRVNILFPHGAKRVDVQIHTDGHPSLMNLLRSPKLRFAKITKANENLTSALLVKKCVVDLELGVSDNIHAEHVIVLLSTLQLKTLKLDCYVNSPAKYCLANSALSKPEHEDSIPALCPDLEQLEIRCSRNTNNAIFFRLLPHLRLTETKLLYHVRQSALNQLRDMERVHLSYVRQTVYNAERIGEAVTEIESQEPLDAQDLEILLGCTRIEALDVHVEATDIDGLLKLVQGLENLKKLRVRFNPGNYYSGKRRRGLEGLPEGTLLKLLTSSQALADISIFGVKAPLEEILESMRLMGGRLQRFTADLKGQDEGMFERLEAFLDCIYKFCPRIEHLWFSECYSVSSLKSQVRKKGKDYSERRKKQKEIGQRLTILLKGLRKRTRLSVGLSYVEDIVKLLI